jgi:hypothetical protein
MPEKNELHNLSLSDLRQGCSQGKHKGTPAAFQVQDNSQRHCFELFRRAITGGDQLAWEAVYEEFQPRVNIWVKGHLYYSYNMEEPEFFTNRAFEKIWAGLSPEKFARLPELNAVLRYLQMCVHSAIVQNLRGRAKTARLDEYVDPVTEREALSASAVPPIPVPAGSGIEERAYIKTQAETLWNMLQERLQNEKERCLIHAHYVLALQPEQIRIRYPQVLGDGEELRRVRDQLLERLIQDAEIRDFFDLDEVELNLEEQLVGMLYRIDCRESQVLGEFFLGFLPEEQEVSIKSHCSDCPHCTRELDQLAAYLEALQTSVERRSDSGQ